MRQLQTPDATIHYIREGTGTPLILVQGAGVVGEGWRPQIDALREHHAIVALDNRGIGGSTYRAATLTIEDMAGDVLAIADAEGFDRFHLAGHSIGGLIAQEIALRARHRVLTLALLCTFERGRQASRLTPDIIWKGLRTRIGSRAMRRQAFMELVMPGAYLAGADRRGSRVAARDAVRPRSRRSAGDRHEAARRRLTLRRQQPPARPGWRCRHWCCRRGTTPSRCRSTAARSPRAFPARATSRWRTPGTR